MKTSSAFRRFLLALLLAQSAIAASAQSCLAAEPGASGAADGNGNPKIGGPALTGARHPLYRLHQSDVVEIKFVFSPEFDQKITVLPDGYVELKAAGELPAEGMTLEELEQSVKTAYAKILREPDVTVVLTDFEHPYFVAGGQVGRPGKYELRSPTSASEAIAIAGGFNEQSKHSQVVLFRRISDGVVESHVLNLKAMLAAKNLEEDPELEPGDMLFVPQNRISKIRRYLPVASLSTFFTPAQF